VVHSKIEMPVRPLSADILLGVAWLIIGVAALVNLARSQDYRWGGDLGPLFLPRIVFWVLVAMATGWLLRGVFVAVRARGTSPTAVPPADGAAQLCRGPAYFAASMIVYVVVLLPYLGFLYASLLFVVCWMLVLLRVQGLVDARHVIVGVVVTSGFTLGVYLVFARMLRVTLP
jgi:hypothetical protein